MSTGLENAVDTHKVGSAILVSCKTLGNIFFLMNSTTLPREETLAALRVEVNNIRVQATGLVGKGDVAVQSLKRDREGYFV